IRGNVQASERARNLARIVLPTPGTASIRRCPSHRRVTRQSRISSSLLTIARLTFDMNASATRPTASGAPTPAIIDLPSGSSIRVEYGGRLHLVPWLTDTRRRSLRYQPPAKTSSLQMRSAIVLVILATLACGSATPTPVVGTPLNTPQLKFAVIDSVGKPVYCDPDFYPIARQGGEQANAISMYGQIKSDPEVFAAIVAHERLPSGDLTDTQKLVAYRAWKLLRALTLTLSGNAYSFQLRVQAKTGGTAYEMVAGAVSVDGVVTVSSRTATGAPNCPICLAATTMIATPGGPLQVTKVRVGTVVWTQATDGSRV